MAQATPSALDKGDPVKQKKTIVWVVALCLIGLIFDGYDIVIFGTVLPGFLQPGGMVFNDLTQAQQEVLTAWAASGPHAATEAIPADVAAAQGAAKQIGGLLGTYALLGVLVGALIAGTFGDIIGRRKIMLFAIAWFSIGMIITAMMNSVGPFGWMRFITGLGMGALVATTGALVSEYAPPGKKNLCTAIVYTGVPAGSLLSAGLSILLLEHIGWHGMFLIGALPLITLLPVAFFMLPESVAWLVSRGRVDEARKWAAKTGAPVPLPASEQKDDAVARPVLTGSDARAGWAGLFTVYFVPTIIIGFVSATGLLLVYSLNTWLPTIMGPLLGPKASLATLVVLNAGAIIGALFGSRFSDKFGPRPTVVACFLIGAVAIFLITTTNVLGLLLLIIAIVGLGTSGTQTLIFAMAATYFRTNVRGAGVAWVAGFGRLGGVGGPILGGYLAARFAGNVDMIFYVIAAFGVLGALLTLLLPKPKADPLAAAAAIQPTVTPTSSSN